MKKLLFGLVLLSMSLTIHSKTYEELLQAGKNYESKKEWFYALGAYYDAMKLSDNPEEAKQKYTELSECIKSGKPGYGEFDVFTLHDETERLIKNAERFFTERFPYKITFDNLKMGSVNYKNKTADYILSVDIKETDLYKNALNILSTGFNKYDMPDMWYYENSRISNDFERKDGNVKKTGLYKTKFKNARINELNSKEYNNESTTFKLPKDAVTLPNFQNEANRIYNANGVAISCFAAILIPGSDYLLKIMPEEFGQSVVEAPAFCARFEPIFNDFLTQASCRIQSDIYAILPIFVNGNYTCYDIKLGLYDENGKLLAEGARKTMRIDESSYWFSDIPQNVMSKLDNGKYVVKLMGIWLNYGVYNISLLTAEDYNKNSIRSIVNPLPDIKINLDNVEFIDIEKQRREEQEKIAQEQKLAEEAQKKHEIFNELDFYCIEYESRKKSAPNKMLKTMETIGVELDNYKVISVNKKSIAQSSKVDTNCELITINNKPIYALQNIALSSFQEIEELLTQANLCRQDNYHDIEKLEEISNTIIKKVMDLRNNFIISINGNYYIDNLPSGTKLQFEKRGKGKTTQIEITVP